MKKRVLAGVLALLLVLPCFSVMATETGWTEETENRLQILSALQIMNLRESGVYGDAYQKSDDRENDPYAAFRNISKRTFLNYVCNIIGDYAYGESNEPEAVALAEQMGLIHPNQEDLSKFIIYDEALTILVRLLGYGFHAEQAGGYPVGYRSIAHKLGLTEGVVSTPEDRLLQSDVVNMLYNAINAPSVEILSYSEDGITYGNSSENTMFFDNRKIFRIDGILEATNGMALREDYLLEDGKARVNGYVYHNQKNFSEALGKNVEGYVKQTDDGMGQLLCVLPRHNQELVIDGKDVKNVTSTFTNLTYEKETGGTKKVSLDAFLKVLYNRQYSKDYTVDSFKPATGKIRLIDNTGDSVYDVVMIEDYKTYVVDYVAIEDEVVQNLYTYRVANRSLRLKNEADHVVKIYSAGNEIKTADIVEGCVLKVLESVVDGRTRKTVYYSNQKISGSVSRIYNDSNPRVLIEGKEYPLSNAYQDAIKAGEKEATEIQVGNSYTLSLDSDGEIVHAEVIKSTEGYGLVLATGMDGQFSKECRIKLYTDGGQWRDLLFADKIEYNGSKGTKPEDILPLIETGLNGAISLVSYRTNSEGEIVALSVPQQYTEENAKSGEFNVIPRQELMYFSNNTSFGNKENGFDLFLRNDSRFWLVYDGLLGEEEGYALGSKSDLRSEANYEFCAYDVDEFGLAKQFVIVKGTGTLNDIDFEYNDMMLVESVGTTMSSDGEPVGMISGMNATYESVSYRFRNNESKFQALNPGDVITMRMDLNGYAEDFRCYYSVADGEVKKDCKLDFSKNLYSAASPAAGKVLDINASEGVLIMDCGEDTAGKTISRNFRVKTATKVAIFDRARGSYRTGTIADITPDDYLVLKMTWGSIAFLVIYR